MTEHNDALNALLKSVQETKVPIGELHTKLDHLLACDRTPEELRQWRTSSGPLKKLCDEVLPVARTFRFFNVTEGTVTFPLDNKVPDCWWHREGKEPVGIEVTVAQGRARHLLARELEEKGTGRGFLGLQDTATSEEAKAAANSKRTMYTTGQAREAMRTALLHCMRQKNDPKYNGMILVIETDMTPIRSVDYESLIPELKECADSTPFSEIYAVGKGEKLLALKLK